MPFDAERNVFRSTEYVNHFLVAEKRAAAGEKRGQERCEVDELSERSARFLACYKLP